MVVVEKIIEATITSSILYSIGTYACSNGSLSIF